MKTRYSLVSVMCVGVPVIAILITLVAGCQAATSVSKDKSDETEPPPAEMKLEPSEYLKGTWSQSEPWMEDDMRRGTRHRTLTFTKSRFIDANAEVLADGTVYDDWQHPGTWSATTEYITKTWHRWIDGEGRDENATIERRHYQWVDDSKTVLLLQEWDSDPDEQPVYREYRKVPPIDLVAVWQRSRVHQNVGEQVWRIDASGPMVTWSYSDARPCTHAMSGPAQVDRDELFLLISVETETETARCGGGEVAMGPAVGHTARWAFAPGHNADTIVVSELWQELELQEDGTWIDREDRPYGEYFQLFVRVAAR